MGDVRAVCEPLLAGLDPDILDYLIDTLEGDEAQEDKEEAISSFLLSCEHCETEEAAADVCAQLFSALAVNKAKDGDAAKTEPKTNEPLKLLETPLSLAALDPDMPGGSAFAAKDPSAGGRLLTMEEALGERKKRKAAIEEERKATRRAHEKVREQRQAEERLLEEARVSSVRLRRERGAYLGAIEAKEFCLPNPGGGPDLLESASFTLTRGRRYGLVGRNGKGKSTLLRALAARTVAAFPPSLIVHYVSQEVQLDERSLELTPLQLVVEADVELRLLLAEEAELTGKSGSKDQTRLETVLERLELIEASTAETRALKLLSNLGFSEELRGRPMKALSGGWRVRTCLAAAIFAKPDVLLLDEPTNHLSIGAVLWLSRELSQGEAWQERIVLIVSHDRVFLDETSTDVLHVSGAARRLTQSHGNYSTWAKRRAQQQKTFARAAELRQTEIDKLSGYAGHGFKYGGSSSQINKMKMKERQAEKLTQEAADQGDQASALQEDMELPLSLKAGGELSGFVLQLRGVGFAYPGQDFLFHGAEIGISSQSRLVLLGENGAGKTTLVKLLLGSLEPTEGEVLRHGGARVGLVNQHHADQIDLTLSPLHFMMERYPGDGSYSHEQVLRSHLNQCGVPAELQALPASALSGGQRSRVALAAVSFAEPHVLVLDEPTNNLDLESVAALADCVEKFEGGVVLVSHDQFFVSRVATEVIVVEKGRVQRTPSFDHYRKQQMRNLQA